MTVGPLFRLSSGVPASPSLERFAGAYVTDGRALFRVVSRLSRPWRRGIVVLEDCRRLAIGAYTAEELWHMALKRVERTA